MHACNNFLSRTRTPIGLPQRIVVMPIPSPVHEARKRGIRTPLYARGPFRPAQQVRDRQTELIEHDDIQVSADGHALDIELTSLAAECLAAARGQGNLRLPPPPRRLRIQYMFDAYRYMRGKGATRFGIRPMDLKHSLSSLLYWRDVCFYSGNDKYASLLLYCKRAIDTLNAGAQVELQRDATGKIIGAKTEISLQVGDEVVDVKGGGDAAAGSAEGGREGPAGVNGCCGYCTLRKKAEGRGPSPWYDAAACAAAELRTCWADTCRAHERPPGCPPDHDPPCPSCDFVCSVGNVAASRKRRHQMSDTARVNHDRKRRKTHAGVEEHQPKVVHQDHEHRQFSALHLMLNGTGTNIGITLPTQST